jgi:mono/diheme cytochrome c family protein
MKSARIRNKLSWVIGCTMVVLFGAMLVFGDGPVGAADTSAKKVAHSEAFKVYQQKCLGCHDSVADPEKPGRTRDDWHLVVNVMHDYGLDMTSQEAEAITDLLYELRKGVEKEAG